MNFLNVYLFFNFISFLKEVNNENIANMVNNINKYNNNVSEEIYNNVLNLREYFKDNTTIISIEL